MNICYVAHASNLTGANRSLLEILSLSDSIGVRPIVIIPSKGIIEEELKKMNIDYFIINYKSMMNSGKLKNFIKKFINKIAVKRIEKILKDKEIDVLHQNSIIIDVGLIAAQNLGITNVCHIREFGAEDHKLEFINERASLERIKRADCSIAISKAIENKFKKMIPDAKISLIYNGVDKNKYTIENKKNFENKIIRILLAGRICEGKGQFEAVKAINTLVRNGIENIKLFIVGDGIKGEQYYNDIINFVKQNNLNKFIEFKPFQKDLTNIRKNTDIALICSKNEAFGRVTIETMLSNQLVIGANTGGTIEIVNNLVNGILYKQGDYEDLAEKIKFATENKEKCSEIIEYAYKYAVNNFLINRTVEEISTLYRNYNCKFN